MPALPAVVLERTSGDEKDGQDADGATVQTIARATAAGFAVLGHQTEEDVPGDTPWERRPKLLRALRDAETFGHILVVREVSRLTRALPHVGMANVVTVDNLEVLGRAHWSRRGGAWLLQDDAAELMRLIDLWAAWKEKLGTRERTQHRMDEFKAGKPTKSGKPPGRPPVVIAPEHLAEARAVLDAGGSMAEAHRRVLELRGFYAAKDPRTAKARNVSKASLGVALGVYSVKNPDASETSSTPAGTDSDDFGSLADGGSPAVAGRNSRPVVSAGSPAAGGAGRGQAVTGGGPA